MNQRLSHFGGLGWFLRCCIIGLTLLSVTPSRTKAMAPSDNPPMAASFSSQELFSWFASAGDYFLDKKVLALANAAARGRTSDIATLLSDAVDVNARGANGVTPLIWTLVKQNKKGFEFLLQHGANPNLQMVDGKSALSYAAMHEDSWYLETALKYGGDPNLVNTLDNNSTPLVYSILAYRPSNIGILIQAGANLQLRDSEGGTPLIMAAAVNRYDVVYKMLDAGADPTIKTNYGTTIISIIRRTRVDPNSDMWAWRTKVINLLKGRGLDVDHGK